MPVMVVFAFMLMIISVWNLYMTLRILSLIMLMIFVLQCLLLVSRRCQLLVSIDWIG